ncbi:MAG: type II secretion system protein [Phycisphaerae bacterium]
MPSFLPQSAATGTTLDAVHPVTSRRSFPRAMTLIEILVVIGILAILVAVALPAIARARHNSRTAQCLSNLHQIGTAFGIYAEMNAYRLPDPGSVGTQWEDLLSSLVAKNTFRCPEDTELFDSLGSSYDWRDTSDPLTTLAGKQVLGGVRQDAVLSFDALPGWHIPDGMNAVFVDGSAKSVPREQCMGDLMQPVSR